MRSTRYRCCMTQKNASGTYDWSTKWLSLTGLAVRALAVEAADPVDASGTVKTGGPGAIVNVHRTVLSGPAVYANTIVRSQWIGTRRAVVTDAGAHGALVHVHLTRITRPLSRAWARVTIHAVHARTTVQAGVRYTIVDVFLAVFTTETCAGKPEKMC